MSLGIYLDEIDKFFKQLNIGKEYYFKINKIMEFFNVLKYVELMTASYKIKNNIKIDFLYRQINKFIKSLNSSNFSKIYNKIDNQFREDFWELINKNIKDFVVDNKYMKIFLSRHKNCLEDVLRGQYLAKKYESVIKDILLSYRMSAEIFLSEFKIKHSHQAKKLYIPIFSRDEKDKVFMKYIASDQANLNYLRIIPYSKYLDISDKVKLASLKAVKKQEKIIFGDCRQTKQEFECEIKFGEFNDEFKSYFKNGICCYEFSSNWIKNNKDYPTILNNFIYLFNFVDKQMRFSNVSKRKDNSLFESIMGVQLKTNMLLE